MRPLRDYYAGEAEDAAHIFVLNYSGLSADPEVIHLAVARLADCLS